MSQSVAPMARGSLGDGFVAGLLGGCFVAGVLGRRPTNDDKQGQGEKGPSVPHETCLPGAGSLPPRESAAQTV